jgi:Uma2 family endonuclease
MTDDELMAFCAKNEFIAIERDADGEIIVMSPSGAGTGNSNQR